MRILSTARAIALLQVLFFPVVALAAAGKHAVTDDRGVIVTLAAPAQRIITLAPHLAELVHTAGAGDRLVGVAEFSDYPEAVHVLPRVGDASRVDIERVLTLAPDLVLGWRSGNPPGVLRRLERLGVPVVVTEPERLADIPRLIRLAGALADTESAAHAAAAAFANEIDALRRQYSDRRPVRMFYEIWHRPLLTVNGSHMISDVIRLCGGVNVFADAAALTPNVSLESLLAARPQAIVGGGSAQGAEAFASQWRAHRLPALAQAELVHVAPDEIQRASIRVAVGARAICEGLERVRARR